MNIVFINFRSNELKIEFIESGNRMLLLGKKLIRNEMNELIRMASVVVWGLVSAISL